MSETGSAWNSAGSWEERDTTKWVSAEVKARLTQAPYTAPNGDTITVTDATVTGEGRILFSRGKKRAGIDISIDAKWKGTINGQSASGKIAIEELSETSLEDFELQLTTSSSADAVKTRVREHGRPLQKHWSHLFTALVEDMKATW
eukprot:m.812524 g.812524  ORF g.812524 m.812524 type:complete len:146 (+) comp59343_c0_seq1:89-526(+)